jgi:DNA invertase Pin-like site-specific DNA recombinase
VGLLLVIAAGPVDVPQSTPRYRREHRQSHAERDRRCRAGREDIAKAKCEGRYKGRVPTARRQDAEIERMKAQGVSPSEIAVGLGIGRASVYRVLGEQADVGDRVAA